MEPLPGEFFSKKYGGPTNRLDIKRILDFSAERARRYTPTNSPQPDSTIEILSKDSLGLASLAQAIGGFIAISEHYGLHLHLIEVSLYDSFSHRGLGDARSAAMDMQSFNVLIACPSEENLKTYEQGLSANVIEYENDCGYDGSPLIHDQSLGYSPYYAKKWSATTKQVDRLSVENMQIAHGTYWRGKVEPAADEDVGVKVEAFLDHCQRKFCCQEGDGVPLNCAVLLPLAHKRKDLPRTNGAGGTQMYNGGGIFFFGSAQEDFDIDVFAVAVRNYLNNSLFSTTFDRRDMEEVQWQKRMLELNIIHHIKSQLTTRLLMPLEHLLLESKGHDSKSELDELRTFALGFVSRIAELMRAAETPAVTDDVVDFETFQLMLAELFASFGSMMRSHGVSDHVISTPQPSHLIKVSIPLLRIVMDELLSNSLSELVMPTIVRNQLKANKMPWLVSYLPEKAEKAIVVRWEEVGTPTTPQVRISVFTTDTALPREVMEGFHTMGFASGVSVRADRDRPQYSTGLGLKIVNKYLDGFGATPVYGPLQEIRFFNFVPANSPLPQYKERGVELAFTLPAVMSGS